MILVGAFLLLAFFALFSALALARSAMLMIVGKSRKTATSGEGQPHQNSQNPFFHTGISLISLGIRSSSFNRDRTKGPVTFFFFKRIPPQEGLE
ncbi:hypothetical protein EBZ37_13135 [bacterium]|nr:hypothetical protein [bacterium]